MANQIIIDIGAAANDGTGDPLRTAFNYVNNNFSNVWNTGLPTSNVAFSDNRIITVNTNGNLVLAPNGVGKVVANVDVVPNMSNVRNLGSITNRWNTVYSRYLNVSGDVDFAGSVTVAGNLVVEGDTIQIGNIVTDTKTIQLSNTAVTANAANGSGITVGANDNIATFLFNGTDNRWTTNIGLQVNGNIFAQNISVGNVFTANGIYGEFSAFTGKEDRGIDAIVAGVPGGTFLGTDVIIQNTGNSNAYTQFNFQNINNGTQASTDYVITANNGNDTTRFLNIGLTNQNWDGTQDNSLGNLLQPNWGYLYVQDGGLVIGTKTGNVANVVTFDPNGTITVPGNILPVGNNTQSLGSATNQWKDLWVSNATIYMNSVPLSLEAGNILTINGQAVLSNDSNTTINTSGNITATNVTATEWVTGNIGVETQQLQFVDNIYSGGSVNILNNGDYLIYESTGIPFVPNSNNAEKIGADDIRWGEIFGNSVYANTVIGDNIITDLGPATGNIVSNVRTWDSAGANLYVWFDANQTPEIVDLNTISGGNVTGWTVSVDGGNQALITATNPAGYFSISTDQALTGSGTLTFTSPDYAPPVANPLTVTVGANNWTFDNTGNLILPSQSNIVGTTPNNSGHLQWIGNSSGDGFGYTTLELVPDDTVGSSQRIVIDPTAPGHIHIRAGGPQDNSAADLFLGGENSYFKVASGANAEVQVTSNSNTWVFNTDGNLQVPGNINGDNNAPLVIDGASSGEGFIRLPSASFGGEQITIVNKFSLGNGIRLETNGGNLFFDNDADLSVTGNVTANYFIGNGSQLTGLPASYTDSNVTALLASLGSNTISGTGNITTTANISGQYVLGNAAFMTGIPASYGNANVATFLANYGSNTISTTGNITAGNITGNINITGNVTGTSANVELVAGSYTWTFDNTGVVTLPAVGGNEGGEINFAIPTANTTLLTPVKVDVYQDRIRFFDGSTKGAYIDMSQAGTGVSTLLNNRVGAYVNAGTYVTMDNLKVTVSTAGNRSLEIATVAGSFSAYVNASYAVFSGGTGGTGASITVTTTPALAIGWNFTGQGDTATYIINDTTNSRCYRVTMMIGGSYNNNMIAIERLI